jgi:Fic family protein
MQKFDPKIPFNNLPTLPPKEDIETKAVLKLCIEARSALAELKVAGNLIPNQAVLINIIPLLEAKDSSAIENIVTTTDNLFRFAESTSENIDSTTKEALRYRTALKAGFDSLSDRPLTTKTASKICSVIKDKPMDIRKVPGTALANDAKGTIIYTPPVGETVIRDLLSNWEKFLHNERDIDPLIKMAISHYQFEAIHPYTDGNGRTGRILNILYLIQEELLTTPILYLSRYIVRNKNDYYRLLLNVTTKNEWEPWILYVLNAVVESCQWTTKKIEAIRKLSKSTADIIRKKLPSVYSRELVDIIFTQPYCRISNVVDAGLVNRQTASTYLKHLCEIGVLKEVKEGREKLFLNPKMIKLLVSEENITND